MMKKESRERNFSAFLFLFSIKIIIFAHDFASTVISAKKSRSISSQKTDAMLQPTCISFIKLTTKWTIITRRTIMNCRRGDSAFRKQPPRIKNGKG